MSDWEAVEAIVQKALPLHQELHEPYHLSLDYRYLAEVALQKQQWETARNHGKMALSFLDQAPQEYQKWCNLYLFILAQAEIKLENNQEGLRLFLEAKTLGDTGHPQIYIKLLTELRSLYTKQKQYLEAFVTKQEQFTIEQQYGYRAFIGAGRLQGKKSIGKSQTDVATEIEASGRKADLDELITRIAKPSYKLIVLYGKSGMGKSSLVNAGLIPQLEHTSFEGRDVCAIAIRVYTNWEEELKKAISPEINGESIIERLNKKESQNKRLVLIFDQSLTAKSRFYLEPELIAAIADDLKDELDEVRPIELQVMGAQLQQEEIKTLANYRQLGENPKAILVERYLNDVIVDCGEENNRLAKFLLFMMTDERGTRPLKTRVELEKDLHDLLAEMQGDSPTIFPTLMEVAILLEPTTEASLKNSTRAIKMVF